MRIAFIAGLAAITLAGCNDSRPGAQSAASLPKLTVAFKWCGSQTPEFTVGGIPATAKSLSLRMVDRQAPGFMHGGGTVAASGRPSQAIACGSLSGSYNGPSPPPPQVHDYQWTVTALDGTGAAVAVGTATRKFPE